MKCGDISYPAVLCIVNTDEIIIVVFVRIIFLTIIMWTWILPLARFRFSMKRAK